MRHAFICLPLLLLASCSSPQGTASGPQAYCARQAEQDPEVTRLTMEDMAVGGVHRSLQPQIRLARHEAMQRCLIAQGVPVRGGVEPVTPR
jgi:hypothetical protein